MRLIAEDVSFSYSAGALLRGVSLTCDVGEALAIMGPSGVGKSTLLALLGGLLAPDSGRVGMLVDGAWHRPEPHVAWVLQTVNMLPDRTVTDNVVLGAFQHRRLRPVTRQVAAEALTKLGLGDHLHKPARVLSGGELQRMVVARGMISGAEFILADEPTGQLDDATTQEVLGALLSSRDTKGLVIVTHDPAVAGQCDRTLHLADHRVRDVG